MKEQKHKWKITNLNVTKYRNGVIIPQVTDATQWEALTTGAWCYYNNDPANEAVYSKLYNWYAINDPRGLAPIGYHIPSESEWTSLHSSGFPLKETGTIHWTSPNNVVTSTIYIGGFNALPGGSRVYNAPFIFDYFGSRGYFWSSSILNSFNAYYSYLDNISSGGQTRDIYKKSGFSVRCLKD